MTCTTVEISTLVHNNTQHNTMYISYAAPSSEPHCVPIDNFRESKEGTKIKDNLPRLLLISGRTAEGLQKVLKNVRFSVSMIPIFKFNSVSVILLNIIHRAKLYIPTNFSQLFMTPRFVSVQTMWIPWQWQMMCLAPIYRSIYFVVLRFFQVPDR